MLQLKAATYAFLVLIDYDLIAFHWLYRAEGTTAVWVDILASSLSERGNGDFSVLNLLFSLFLYLYSHDKAMIDLPLLVSYGMNGSNSFPKAKDL